MNFEQNDDNTLMKIQEKINDNPGTLDVIIHLESNVGTMKKIQLKNKKITCSSHFLSELRKEFGDSNVWIN